MERVILHADMNNFYASVECLDHPELRGKAVAVCADPELRHGIVLAKNQRAKGYGVRTGQAVWEARQQCKDLVVVPPHYDRYLELSAAARAIYTSYTDQVEPFGLDECWLDVGGSSALFGPGPAIADGIRTRIRQELGLTVSVGVSFNKVFAKLGSDMKKPDATTIITRENYREVVWSQPVSDLLYVGPATTRKLGRYGVRDASLFWYERQTRLERPVCNSTDLFEAAFGLFLENRPPRPVRSLSVRASGLSPTEACTQLSFFPEVARSLKQTDLERAMDKIRAKYGYHSIQRGLMLTDPALNLDAKGENIIHPIGFLGTLQPETLTNV